MKLGQKVRAARKALGLTQKKLGQEVGVSKQSISRWESGDDMPQGANLLELTRVLGLEHGWFAAAPGDAPPSPQPAHIVGSSRGPIAHLPDDLDPVTRASIEAHLVNQVALFERMTQEMAELRRAVMELRSMAPTPEEVTRDSRVAEAEANNVFPFERPIELAKERARKRRPRRRKPKA